MKKNNSKKIVMLTGNTRSSAIVYNALIQDFDISAVLQEEAVPMKQIMKNRAKRLGWVNVGGQIMFGLLLLPFIKKFSKNQTKRVIEKLNIDLSPIPETVLTRTDSVNSTKTLKLLQELKPDLVIVNGCRIISKKILNNTNAVFMNTHEGITPKYRGIHGGYWALANNDRENCGVTVHLVDQSVDTGDVIYQARVSPEKSDNFTTYPLYQTAEGSKILKLAVEDFCNDHLKTISGTKENFIWYHPTIWQYLYYRIFRGVK